MLSARLLPIFKKIVKLLSNFFFVGNINSINFKGAGKFKLLVVSI